MKNSFWQMVGASMVGYLLVTVVVVIVMFGCGFFSALMAF